MESIKNIKINLPKRKVYYWQDLASRIRDYMIDGKEKAPSIFKVCKDDQYKAERAFNTCKEKEIRTINYFFKLIKIYE